ncbi:hypothetical protein DFH11DRAFT_1621215 [Phellopilus nigrolimitatus]|nr:hypothetical protein DFH11DRAFT_1621215 [Phellopilus nigrolimitatus]
MQKFYQSAGAGGALGAGGFPDVGGFPGGPAPGGFPGVGRAPGASEDGSRVEEVDQLCVDRLLGVADAASSQLFASSLSSSTHTTPLPPPPASLPAPPRPITSTTGVAADPAFVAATVSAGPQPAAMYSVQVTPVMLPPLDYHGLDAAQLSPDSVKLVSDFFHDKEPNELIQ